MDIDKLVTDLLNGDRRSVAKLITLVESSIHTTEIMSRLYPHTGNARVVGFTGPPGVGKSTLISGLTSLIRRKNMKVGIIAIDPTSPFTGGALLGDRIRMADHTTDNGVFIRSMGTRGMLGGLSNATRNTVKILDAFGMDFILIETVGAGQCDISIHKISQTVVVIMVPGLGDEVQTLKSGLFELGDIFVVNKCDRDNAENTTSDLVSMVNLWYSNKNSLWKPPVIKVTAIRNEGIDSLYRYIEKHTRYLKEKADNIETCRQELTEIIEQRLSRKILWMLKDKEDFEKLLRKIAEKKIDPYSAAGIVLTKLVDIRIINE
jgi:LAO/AO transport system kinase